MGLDDLILASEPIINKIIEIIKAEHPIIVAKIAEDLFANEGDFNNRPRWKPNTASTIKKKGGNSPNIETGELENWLSTPGNADDDDYMFKLPPSKRQSRTANGYWYANELRHFDDIGKTDKDKELIDKTLERKIGEEFDTSA